MRGARGTRQRLLAENNKMKSEEYKIGIMKLSQSLLEIKTPTFELFQLSSALASRPRDRDHRPASLLISKCHFTEVYL